MLLVEKGDTTRGVELLQKAVGARAQCRRQFASISLGRLIKAGQKDAAKKELDTLAKLGDKFAGQAEVAKLMQGL